MENRKCELKVSAQKQSLGMSTYPEPSWAWSGMRLPVTEVKRTRHHEVRILGLSTWTDKPSRIMAG